MDRHKDDTLRALRALGTDFYTGKYNHESVTEERQKYTSSKAHHWLVRGPGPSRAHAGHSSASGSAVFGNWKTQRVGASMRCSVASKVVSVCRRRGLSYLRGW